LKPGAVSKYYLIAEYKSIYLSQLKEMLHIGTSSNHHTDLQPSRIAKDENDVKALMQIMEDSWINPFKNEVQDLVCLSSGKLATSQIQKDLLRAQQEGGQAYKRFSAERLETNTPKFQFNDKISKLQLKTCADLTKKMKIHKQTSKEVILKADRKLFAQMIIVAENRKLRMRDVSCHPLGPLPWSLHRPMELQTKQRKPPLQTTRILYQQQILSHHLVPQSSMECQWTKR